MGTEKFIAFKEDGTAYRLKGRILRFLDNEPVSEADKTNIRSTLSVPASAEGLTPANNLSDLDNAATARTNLSVNSIDEDAEATGTKLVGPALYFRGAGPNDYLEVADDAKFSFTDGTDDLPFTIAGWVKAEDLTNFCPLSKFATVNKEWGLYFDNSDKLNFFCYTDGSNYIRQISDSVLTSYEGQLIHVVATYGGSGPNSATAFSSGYSEMTVYINGEVVATTGSHIGTYAGMSNTAQPVYAGRANTSYSKGSIREVKVFNRELSAAEVREVFEGGLGFADEWAGALGGVYTQDATPSGEWSVVRGTASDEAGPINGRANVLGFTVNADPTNHYLRKLNSFVVGKRYRVALAYYIPVGNAVLDGIRLYDGAYIDAAQAVTGSWTNYSVEFVANNTDLRVYAFDGNNNNVNDPTGTDIFYIDGLTISEIGTLADFRAEDFNESAGKLLDRSTNNFVGVNNGATLVGARRHISADTIDLKNLPTSSAGLSAGEVWSNGGVLTVV